MRFETEYIVQLDDGETTTIWADDPADAVQTAKEWMLKPTGKVWPADTDWWELEDQDNEFQRELFHAS